MVTVDNNINTSRIFELKAIAEIGDAVRGTLYTEKLEQIPALLQSLAEQITTRGGEYYIKNFWSDRNPLSLGYVGIHVKIRMPLIPGSSEYILMEVQIHAKQIMDGTKNCAKEIAHRLYKMPEEETEKECSPDIISASQLMYLTSMAKLLRTEAELKKTASIVNILGEIEGKEDSEQEKMRLVRETALLLNNENELGDGEWNKQLKAVVPKNKDAVAKAWIDTAAKINKRLNLPTCDKNESSSWTNTAKSVDELLENAGRVADDFHRMCGMAAADGIGLISYGPENKQKIKTLESLQIKIKKDIESLRKKFLSAPTLSSPGSQPAAPSLQASQIISEPLTLIPRTVNEHSFTLNKKMSFVRWIKTPHVQVKIVAATVAIGSFTAIEVIPRVLAFLAARRNAADAALRADARKIAEAAIHEAAALARRNIAAATIRDNAIKLIDRTATAIIDNAAVTVVDGAANVVGGTAIAVVGGATTIAGSSATGGGVVTTILGGAAVVGGVVIGSAPLAVAGGVAAVVGVTATVVGSAVTVTGVATAAIGSAAAVVGAAKAAFGGAIISATNITANSLKSMIT